MKRSIILFLTMVALARGASLLPSSQEFLSGLAMPNDSVCLVCEQVRSGHRRQWLMLLSGSAHPLRSGEQSVSGITALFQRTLHCSTGRDYRFADQPFAMDVRMIGPFEEAPPAAGSQPNIVAERSIGNRIYFDPGVYRTGQVYDRIRATGQAVPALSFLFSANYSAEQIAADRAKAKAAGISEEDEREIARSGFALNQFGLMAGKLDAFRDLLDSVIDVPTLFHGMYINIDWNKLARVPEVQTDGRVGYGFEAPLRLQTRTWLSGRIRMVRPTGPLRYCAGIVEVEFGHSQKAPGTVMRIWLHAAVDVQGGRTDFERSGLQQPTR